MRKMFQGFLLLLTASLGCQSEANLAADAALSESRDLVLDAAGAVSRSQDSGIFRGEHRAEAVACGVKPSDWTRRPLPHPNAVPPCSVSNDCGPGGHCTFADLRFNVPGCVWDECYSDADCGDGLLCACGTSQPETVNRCVFPECLTDKDCTTTHLCSPSYGCYGSILGGKNYHCRTPDDECQIDADCGGGSRFCGFDATQRKWHCIEPTCFGRPT